MIHVRLLIISFCFLITAQAQALLDDFATMRKGPSDDNLWRLVLNPASGQKGGVVENGMFKVIGDPNHSNPIYWDFFTYPYSGPTGFAQAWIKSGAKNANYNRLRFKMKCNQAMTRRSDGGPSIEVGTYVKTPQNTVANNQGQHYYHSFGPNVYPNRWMQFTMNRHPQHRVGNPGSQDYPEDPEYVNPTSGAPVHYFEGFGRFYFNSYYGAGDRGATCYFDDFEFALAPSEPDTLVSSVTATHTGTAYEVTWSGPKEKDQQYEIRYSTASLKSAGFTSGTDGGKVSNNGSSYVVTAWKSPAMAEVKNSGLYVGIRPVGQTQFTEIVIPPMNGGTTQVSSKCDINADGTVNDADVTLARNAALGTTSCTADLDNNGRCDVVDVQRVINAGLGQACRVQ